MFFINPLFLIGASAALLPVIFHLIRKMRAHKVQFSSLIFLKASPKELIKKRRLRDLILLITRSVILGMLAFSFARPYFPSEKIPFITRVENRSVVILIDNSYSMQYSDYFELAKEEALRKIDSAEPADEFAIVVFSDGVRQLTDLNTDRAAQRDVLSTLLTVSNRTTDFYYPIIRAEEILQEAEHPKREILLISDLQENAWTSQFEDWNLDDNIAFIPVEIGESVTENAFISRVAHIRLRTGEKVNAEFKVGVSEQSGTSVSSMPVELWINGDRVETKNLDPLQSNSVIFQRYELERGNYQGFFALPEDGLEIDNRYYFSFSVEDPPSILCIDGASSNAFNTAFYLKSAFDLGETAEYRFSTGTKNNLTVSRLQRHAIVFLANTASLTRRQRNTLKGYVENGGTVILSFGELAQTATVSSYLSDFGLGTVEGVVRSSALRELIVFGEYNNRHPVFSLFAQTGAGDLFRPRFVKYVKILPGPEASVIASFNTGDPLLVERPFGNGKFIAFASTFDKSWNDLPLTEIYVPLVYQIGKYALNSVREERNFLAGNPVQIQGLPGEEWELTAPGNRLYPIVLDESGREYFRETESPGNYTAASRNRGEKRYIFSVNLNVQESQLDSRDFEEVYADVAFQPEPDNEDLQAAAVTAIFKDEKEQKMWRYGLLFILALFIFETIFANRKKSA